MMDGKTVRNMRSVSPKINKFEKRVHQVCFTIEIYYNARNYERQKKKIWLYSVEYSSNKYVVHRIQGTPFSTSKTGSPLMLISVGSELAKINKLYDAGFRDALVYPKTLRLSFSFLLHMCIQNE
jgi:hypothetical protein